MKTIQSAAVCLVMLLVGTQDLFADEPAARFLDALRDKGYFDIALEYLDKAKDNPSVSEDFRKRVSFEKAKTLIDQVGQISQRKKVDAQLDMAQKLLAEYAASSNSLVETVRSLSFRSRLLTMRADVFLGEANADRLTESERQQLRDKAQTYLNQSIETVKETLASAKPLLDDTPGNRKALKISADDPQTRELVNEIRNIYRVMTVQLPINVEQLANTYPERSPDRKSALQAAAAQYKRIWEGPYSNSIPGLRACLHAGLCYQKLGNDKEALDFLKQVISRDRSAATDSIQKEAFAAAGDSWQKIKPYPARSVISQLEPVVEKLSRSENRDPEWLRVKLELGIAKYEMSKVVKEEGGPNATTKSKAVKREAGRLVRDVTRVKNPSRDRARKLLEDWDVPLIEPADEVEDEAGELKNFAAALEVGNDQISEIELLAGEWLRARNRAKSAPPNKQDELTAEADKLGKQLDEQADQTISILNEALSLAGSNTTPDEINTCRFYQTYCYFVTNRYLEVSVIGEYLLKRHPNDAGTKAAVGLLLKSRSAMYAAAAKDDNQAELQSLKNTALVVAKRWPGSPQAGDAISELIQISLRQGDMPQAIELMDRLPGDNAKRPLLAAAMGQRLWNTYQKDSKDKQKVLNINERKKQLNEAVRFLEVAGTLATAEVGFSDAVTGLNLIDALLEGGKPEEALEVLEKSKLSPVQVLKNRPSDVFEHPKVDLYRSNAYSVIIKTYLAKLATAKDQRVWIEKANGVISLMEQEAEASDSEAAKRQLTAIQYLISVELGKRFENTTDKKQRLSLSNAMADFLDKISQNTKNPRVLLNSSQTLMTMASGLAEDGDEKKAKVLFKKATSAVDKAQTLGFGKDPKSAALLQRQRAVAQRGSGQYEKAVDSFTALLKKSKSLPIQLDAAATLQQWGKSQGLATQLTQAVNGTGRFQDPKTKRQTNAIWGWAKIMRLTQGNKVKYREEYFAAAYGIAEAIYEQGKAKQQDTSKKALARIKDERVKTPDFLGSKAWKDKFSNLEKRIQNKK